MSSVTRENRAYLARKQIWKHVDESRVRGIEEMQVWDGVSGSRIEFFAERASPHEIDAPVQPMSYMVENRNLQRAALRSMEDTRADLDVFDNHKVVRIERDDGGWPIAHLVNAAGYETSIRARLLVRRDCVVVIGADLMSANRLAPMGTRVLSNPSRASIPLAGHTGGKDWSRRFKSNRVPRTTKR